MLPAQCRFAWKAEPHEPRDPTHRETLADDVPRPVSNELLRLGDLAITALGIRTLRIGGIFLYLVIGILVAASVIGRERNYFSELDNLEEIGEMIIAVLVWPLVLLDVNINLGGVDSGGQGSGKGDGGGGK
jgi:hypothetical protein